jgi:hypothetical protein
MSRYSTTLGFITKQLVGQAGESSGRPSAPTDWTRLSSPRQWVVLRQSIGHLAKHGLIAASGLLMPSKPFAYPQVIISRRFAYFRVVKIRVSAAQCHLCAEFDSRQLH